MATGSSGEAEGIYRMNLTICREVRGEPWGDEYMLEINQSVWGIECIWEFEGTHRMNLMNIRWSDDQSTVRLDRLLRNTYVILLMVLRSRAA